MSFRIAFKNLDKNVTIGNLLLKVNEKAREGANVHLRSVGLSLSAYQTGYGHCINSSNTRVRGEIICRTATLEEIDIVQMNEEKVEE